MRKLLVLLSLFLIPTALGAEQNKKVSHITGIIDPDSTALYIEESKATADLPGDRTIYIDSLGGYLMFGQLIIDAMEAERAANGTRMICIVEHEATSMAFNILTHCDERYAAPEARFLVHKAAAGQWPDDLRPTAKNMRLIANQLDREDMPYKYANMKAMHLTEEEYDAAADEEKTWTSKELLKIGYLNGIKDDNTSGTKPEKL